jgi:mannose-6-phosphate isomerase-like protein (cupin superfamily)
MIAKIRTACAIALIMAAAPLTMGSASADKSVWHKSELQALQGKLTHELDAEKSASEALGEYGNHHVEIAHREATGNAELHETQNDVFFILSGEATLVQGGTLVDPKTTEPHELEGKSIEGGTRTKLVAGDVVHIPFKTPHQLILENGKQITYFVVKISAP